MLSLEDTRTGQRREIDTDPVRIFTCGVTPYDTTHLGHAFTFVQVDTLVRVLRWLGREVIVVQNVTDIDDSILARARSLGTDWKTLGDEQLLRYLADMRALGVEAPTHLVPATSEIATIHELITRLLERGAAYLSGGNVYFRVGASPGYGELSKLTREEMIEISAAQDDADVDDPRKADPLDTALWKAWSGAPDEPFWESPWGQGRPGWHVECAAINLRHLGDQITIHGGGADLVYPHHETETALMETATGARPFVEAWFHVGMVRMGGEKMSKSLGNMAFVADLLPRHGPDAVRLALLGHHYRSAFEWFSESLDRAAERLTRLRALAGAPVSAATVSAATGGGLVAGNGSAAAAGAGPDDEAPVDIRAAFTAALEDDLNVPRALHVLEGGRGPIVEELAGVLGLRLVP